MDRLIVTLRTGRAELRAVVSPGRAVRVGRAERCDLVVGGDDRLSSVHFEISWDGETATVVDLHSKFGTDVDGNAITGPAACRPICVIRGGDSLFTLHGEDATPPDEPSKLLPAAAAAGRALRRSQAPLYALVDASRGPRVRTLLEESVDAHASLYDGVQGRKLASVAPFLVRIAPDSMLLDRLLAEGWTRRWCTFLTSRAPFVELRRHFRRFLMVEDETRGVKMFFRFYDPATLRTFLRAANRRQKDALFAAVERFYLEDDDGSMASLGAET